MRLGWALVTHPERCDLMLRGLMAPLLIQESSIPTACAHGWKVLIRDGEMEPSVSIDVNLQRNPNRQHGETKEDV